MMTISVLGLLLGLLLLAVPLGVMHVFDFRMKRRLWKSAGRMFLSTAILGTAVYGVVRCDNAIVNVLACVAIVIVSAVAVVMRAKLPVRQYLIPVSAGLFVSVAVVGTYLLLAVMTAGDALSARVLLPVMALLSSSSVLSCAEALSVYRMGIQHNSRLYYYLTGNGASHAEALFMFVRRALQKSVVRATRSMAVVGTALAPALMWVMALNGSDVFTAVAFQIVMMVATLAATMLAVILTLVIARRYTIDEYDRLRQGRATKELLPDESHTAAVDEQ